MLGGISPVLIFQFGQIQSLSNIISEIPIVSEIPTIIEQPPIPIYLDEGLTGLFIVSESKNIDVETSTETMSDGSTPAKTQKGISSSITITMECLKDSIGITLLSAMMDLVFEKVTSKEYALSYLHGSTTIFRGMLQSYTVDQNQENNKLTIQLVITKGEKNPQKAQPTPVVPRQDGAAILGT